MSSTEVIDPADVICGLKAAVTALECYHNINLIKQQRQQHVVQEKRPPPMYMMIPIEEEKEKRTPSSKNKLCIEPPPSPKRPAKICDQAEVVSSKFNRDTNNCYDDAQKHSSTLNFPEMRNGILFSRCNCVHRDGLQDDCPLSQCQGQPECLVKPWPVCPPGMFLRSRHPELYSSPRNSDSILR